MPDPAAFGAWLVVVGSRKIVGPSRPKPDSLWIRVSTAPYSALVCYIPLKTCALFVRCNLNPRYLLSLNNPIASVVGERLKLFPRSSATAPPHALLPFARVDLVDERLDPEDLTHMLWA